MKTKRSGNMAMPVLGCFPFGMNSRQDKATSIQYLLNSVNLFSSYYYISFVKDFFNEVLPIFKLRVSNEMLKNVN